MKLPRIEWKKVRGDAVAWLVIVTVGIAMVSPTLFGNSLPMDLRALPGPGELTAPAVEDLDAVGRRHAERVYPGFVFLQRSAANGESVLWNPDEFLGTPFLAAWTTRCLSPFSIPFYLFPLQLAFGLSMLAKSVVAGLAAYITTRKLGYTAWLSTVCALGYQLSYGLVALPLDAGADVLPWVPLLFLFSERAYLRQVRYWPTGGVTIALMLLGGDWVAVAWSLLVFLVYIVLHQRLYPHDKGYALRLGTFGAAVLTGIALSAVQLLPYLEYVRSTVALDESGRALPQAKDWLRLVLVDVSGPKHFGMLHLGIVQALSILLWAVMRPSLYEHHRRKIDTIQAVSLGALAVIIGYGLYASGGATSAWLSHEQLMVPLFFLTTIGMVITLSIWLELTPEQCRSAMMRGVFVAGALLIGLTVLVVYGGDIWQQTNPRSTVVSLVVICGFALALGVTLVKPAVHWLAIMLIVLLAINAMGNARVNTYQSPAPDLTVYADQEDAWLAGQLSHPQFVSLHTGVAQNRGTVTRPLHDVYAFLAETEARPELVGLMPANQVVLSMEFLEPMSGLERSRLRFEGIEPDGLARFSLLEHTPDLELVSAARIATGEGFAELDPDAPPVIEGSPSVRTPARKPMEPRWLDEPKNGLLRVEVFPESDSVLVVNRALGPGWVAEVDAQQVPILRVNGVFAGVQVDETSDEVVLRYRPLSYRIGRLISIAAAIIAALGYFNLLYHRFHQRVLGA